MTTSAPAAPLSGARPGRTMVFFMFPPGLYLKFRTSRSLLLF
eukprot:CAMPEP_0114312900 /NCGR_PEP_ID=MMETSP0059-20121206/20761_1 /TAXON_ID=36894 /ORGANISM="Pyramimonas parkeae, Strain CCMP726" /LENGTH=41 /DNA_ID= /DNA_START= /DNA_END= /DNA_ORIENTATION=